MATLKSLVDETTNIKNEIVECHSNLSSILTSKNVEVTEEDKLSNLIGKVDLLGDVPPPPLYLYKEGDECSDVTGGWEFGYMYNSAYGITETPTMKKNTDNIYMQQNQGSTSMGQRTHVITNNKIDVTNYSKLKIVLTINGAFENRICLTDVYQTGKITSYNGAIVVANTTKDTSVVMKEYELDISSISSSYYVNHSLHSVGGTKKTTIHKIWLEA